MYYGVESIEQCNDITRKIAEKYKDRISFIDFDNMMTGKMNHLFKDLGHVVDEGRQVKAGEVQKVIWEVSQSQRENMQLQENVNIDPVCIEGTVEFYVRQIKEYEVWLNDIAIEAKNKGQKLDDVILEHAKYMAWQYDEKNK